MLVVIEPSQTHSEQRQPSLLNLSYCRLCQYYQFTGRREGFCKKLGVPVNGNWLSCSLVEFPFAIKRRQKNEGA
ncbi:MAG: hypothetical protein QNJ18_02795 [Xenococcaceae cyanobacterium MO_167.B52]|nr:hypothetical protein [Xenococcaceae cyanobacterium MO_167.B52]